MKFKLLILSIIFSFLAVLSALASEAGDARKPVNWWVQFIVDSLDDVSMRDKTNYIGEHAQASDEYDSRDLREMPPFTQPFLTLYFPVSWDKDGNHFTSDFRALPERRESPQLWSFIIESDTKRKIRLSWVAADSAELAHMVLIDEGNDIEIDARNLQYEVQMTDVKHRFSWRYKVADVQLTED